MGSLIRVSGWLFANRRMRTVLLLLEMMLLLTTLPLITASESESDRVLPSDSPSVIWVLRGLLNNNNGDQSSPTVPTVNLSTGPCQRDIKTVLSGYEDSAFWVKRSALIPVQLRISIIQRCPSPFVNSRRCIGKSGRWVHLGIEFLPRIQGGVSECSERE